jgi:hypothetical protein
METVATPRLAAEADQNRGFFDHDNRLTGSPNSMGRLPPLAGPGLQRRRQVFFTALRGRSRLVAISLCDRPEFECAKISVTCTTSNVLLAIRASVSSSEREQPSSCEDHASGDTHVVRCGIT